MERFLIKLDLANFGLETTEQAATRRGQHPATVRKWVADGILPAVPIGKGRTTRYLVEPAVVDAIPIRERGAPKKNANAKKPTAPKKRKPKAN